ncbi:mRNA 3'-end-processing protein yth-1 [Cytospora mali]|uniref:mRNA 3'-end-processing protein n=1 Tax=Cytospora mali TaxID=578113 RepID=A0A194W3R6_CYTMA|nr:mRNA 3'-end-processing protein yth-1 [Valsa mali]
MAPSAAATATSMLSQQMLAKTTPQTPPTFSFTPFLQRTYLHSLPVDRPICRAYTNGHCPLGTRCPDRHVSTTNSAAKQDGGFGHAFNSLVCKHWLRGLCKKGESCEFLHEFNLRKMPECNFFLRNGFCSNGDECLYLHIDPQSKLPPCPHYDKGFCPLGPRCAKKHVRKKMCPYFLAGFCPDGPECKQGAHPKWKKDLEKPTVKVEKKEEDDVMQTVVTGIGIGIGIGIVIETAVMIAKVTKGDLVAVVGDGEEGEVVVAAAAAAVADIEKTKAARRPRGIFLGKHVHREKGIRAIHDTISGATSAD